MIYGTNLLLDVIHLYLYNNILLYCTRWFNGRKYNATTELSIWTQLLHLLQKYVIQHCCHRNKSTITIVCSAIGGILYCAEMERNESLLKLS